MPLTFSRSAKYYIAMREYIRMLLKMTAMPESCISLKKTLMVFINMSKAFVSPKGITTYLYKLYLVRNAVLGTFSSIIWHCQYPPQRSINVKYYTLPIWSKRSL